VILIGNRPAAAVGLVHWKLSQVTSSLAGENPHPKLRPLDAFPVEVEGRRGVALRDPEGIAPDALVLTPEAFFVALLFDGERTTLDVQSEFARRFGGIVPSQAVEEISRALDERLFLDSEGFRRTRRERVEAFRALATRPAAHAGSGYPPDPAGARARLEEILAKADGTAEARDAVGLITPHIDFFRGEETYARTYAPLQGTAAPDLALVLGTSHAATAKLAALTRKDYETPFGTARTETGVVDAICAAFGDDLFADEFVHRNEHAGEFQVLWLKHLFPETPVVPVLCGGLARLGEDGRTPGGTPDVERFVDALLAGVHGRGRLLVVAGADLAHVGPRFGGPPALTPAFLSRVEREDRLSLDAAAALDAEGFYRTVMDGGDPRNVCGTSPIYFAIRVLRALGAKPGTILDYRQCTAEDQSVTIGAVLFPG
jgi:hypothetical protein